MELLSYSFLREIQKKESDSAKLTALGENFYVEAANFLKKKREEAFSTGSILAIREYENIKKIISTIKEKREEKLVLIALRSEGIPTGLTPEEIELLEGLSHCVGKFRTRISAVLPSEENTLPRARGRTSRVKMLKDVEPYKGLDNNIYGPFKNGEEVELPKEEAEWLLKAGMAESAS